MCHNRDVRTIFTNDNVVHNLTLNVNIGLKLHYNNMVMMNKILIVLVVTTVYW